MIYKALFLKSKQKKFLFFLLAVKKSHLRACVILHTSNYSGMMGTVLLNCPIKAEIRAADSQLDSSILLWL